jgi:membrane-associated PAP2 superfamily phosphatase
VRRDVAGPRTLQTLQHIAFATAIASVIFTSMPEIDQGVARAFYQPGLGFPLSQEPAFKLLRWLGRVAPTVAIGGLIALLAIRIVRRRSWTWVSDASIAYVLAVFALGPLVMSNLLFKANWGRPRPSQTNLFSGNLEFTPAWQVSGQCGWNCSFVSGEASMSIALIAFAFLAPKPYRATIIAAVCAWTALISWNRMAFGAHFLSDVVLAAAMTAMIALALKSVMLDGIAASVKSQRGAFEAA